MFCVSDSTTKPQVGSVAPTSSTSGAPSDIRTDRTEAVDLSAAAAAAGFAKKKDLIDELGVLDKTAGWENATAAGEQVDGTIWVNWRGRGGKDQAENIRGSKVDAIMHSNGRPIFPDLADLPQQEATAATADLLMEGLEALDAEGIEDRDGPGIGEQV